MSKLNFNNNSEDSPKIEIVLQVRDHNGNPTGKTRSYCSDDYSKASQWYSKQASKKRKKKKKKGNNK